MRHPPPPPWATVCDGKWSLGHVFPHGPGAAPAARSARGRPAAPGGVAALGCPSHTHYPTLNPTQTKDMLASIWGLVHARGGPAAPPAPPSGSRRTARAPSAPARPPAPPPPPAPPGLCGGKRLRLARNTMRYSYKRRQVGPTFGPTWVSFSLVQPGALLLPRVLPLAFEQPPQPGLLAAALRPTSAWC